MLGAIGKTALSGLLTIFGPMIIGFIASLLTDAIQWLLPVIKKMPPTAQQVLAAAMSALLAAVGTALGVQLCPNFAQTCGLDNLDVNAAAAALFSFAKKHAAQIQALKAQINTPPAASVGGQAATQ